MEKDDDLKSRVETLENQYGRLNAVQLKNAGIYFDFGWLYLETTSYKSDYDKDNPSIRIKILNSYGKWVTETELNRKKLHDLIGFLTVKEKELDKL